MALFEWSDDYSVKVPSIDAQHKQLVGLLNELHDGMFSGAGMAHLESVLGGLIEYTAHHFAHEEELFAAHGYPLAEAHIAEHRRLVEQVLDYKRKLEAGEVSLNMELMMFLKNWLIKHILGSDKLYVAHFVERRVQ